jgi:Tol biopolymer transport system component
VLGEWVYYQKSAGSAVHRVNEAGQDERFDFMILPESSFETVDWAISPDGTQIVWNLFTYESTQSGGPAITSDLYIATIATGETRLLISHVLPEARILTPWRFTPDGSQVFVYLQLYGIGGFWRGYGAFSALDVATGQLTPLPDPAHDPAPEESFPGSAAALGDDGTRLVRFLYVQDQGFRVTLTDLASGQTTEIMALPSELEYVQVGDAVLSPDGSTLIYTVAHGDWGSEGFVMFQVDLAAGTQRELLSLQPNRYKVVRFEDDGSLLLTADRPREERGTWRLHPDGTLEHLSELTLVGVAE